MKRRSLLGILAGVLVPLPMLSAKEVRKQEAVATDRIGDILRRESDRIEGDICIRVLNQCPWLPLIQKQDFPRA